MDGLNGFVGENIINFIVYIFFILVSNLTLDYNIYLIINLSTVLILFYF